MDLSIGVVYFLTAMILGTTIVLLSFGAVLYQLWMIEQNKAEILSLYALLKMEEITQVYLSCQNYMSALNSGSMMSHLNATSATEEQIDSVISGNLDVVGVGSSTSGLSPSTILKKPKRDDLSDEDSEEEKGDDILRDNAQKKRRKASKIGNPLSLQGN